MDRFINQIICGDCLDVMRELPDKSIHLIATDPPYNIGKAEWDKIPNYIEWLGTVFLECQRVLRDNGSFYFFHNDFLQIVDLQKWIGENTDFVFKQLITWCKIDPRFKNYGFVQQRLSNGTARNYYSGFTEYCLFYTFQDETGLELITEKHVKPRHPFAKYLQEEFKKAGVNNREIAALFPSRTGGLTGCVSNWLNGDNVITKEQYLIIREYLNGDYLRREYDDLRREYDDLRYPYNVATVKGNVYANSTVWKYPPAPQIGHITPKPVELMENIILHSSNEGNIIFDPFLGSGTTAVAALNTGRFFIGIEKEEKYCDIARNRVEKAKQENSLFTSVQQ